MSIIIVFYQLSFSNSCSSMTSLNVPFPMIMQIMEKMAFLSSFFASRNIERMSAQVLLSMFLFIKIWYQSKHVINVSQVETVGKHPFRICLQTSIFKNTLIFMTSFLHYYVIRIINSYILMFNMILNIFNLIFKALLRT